jgi:phenylpropionate dioxygenase-like ring-hydroxylating dioxygenase large terminal subunit
MADGSGVKEPTFGKWLASDARKADPIYAKRADQDLGVEDLPIERYISRSFHDKERDKMWPRAWQMACHETNIPSPGDYITYDICGRSVVLVRLNDGEIKAYPNACLHRGMQLVDDQGKTAAFACRFHGWTWNLDGTLKKVPERWDFPQIESNKLCLPELKVANWGGFVFINFDSGAEPFEKYIGELPEHFASAPLENRKIALHVARIMPANWKVAMEAFLESYHVSPTHPQAVPVSEYPETQYDIYNKNLSRLATISIAPVGKEIQQMTPQEFADMAAKSTGREPIEVHDGETYRNALARSRRDEVAAAQGEAVEHLTDCEMLDAVEYFLFPNFLPWHGFGLPIVYRFRPNGDRHDSSIMEIYLLAPRNLAEPSPPAPKMEWLPEDRPFAECETLGRLGPIFDQDYDNIIGIWRGLASTWSDGVILGKYQEARIRHYHNRIDEFVDF